MIGNDRGCGCRMLLGIMLALATFGCREKSPSSEVIPLEGRVENVDTVARTITATYRSPKRDEDIVGTAEVTPETEILVNGVISTLADVKVGDRIRGEVRVEGHGEQKKMFILKINVERPKTLKGPGQ